MCLILAVILEERLVLALCLINLDINKTLVMLCVDKLNFTEHALTVIIHQCQCGH